MKLRNDPVRTMTRFFLLGCTGSPLCRWVFRFFSMVSGIQCFSRWSGGVGKRINSNILQAGGPERFTSMDSPRFIRKIYLYTCKFFFSLSKRKTNTEVMVGLSYRIVTSQERITIYMYMYTHTHTHMCVCIMSRFTHTHTHIYYIYTNIVTAGCISLGSFFIIY